jgi:Arc/MetJ-type ribon-helix-helix transcriptional regulator
MTLSVRLDPSLEARIDQESRRRGVSKSEVVKDALERVLGLKNPYDLLQEIRSPGAPGRRSTASESTGAGLKAKLRAKRSA